jgi:hypothetical protein
MFTGGLRTIGLVACASLASVSFFGTRALLRAAVVTPESRGPAAQKQRVVQLPHAATIDLMALGDYPLWEARAALVQTLQNDLIRHPACEETGDDGVRGTISVRYRLAARDGALHASRIGSATFAPEPGSVVSDPLASCLIARLEPEVSVTPPRTKLTRSGDLGEKTFELAVGPNAGLCAR